MSVVWVVELLADGEWLPVGWSDDEAVTRAHAEPFTGGGEVRVREVDAADLPGILAAGGV